MSTKLTTNNLRSTAERLYGWGANITIIGKGGKKPIHTWGPMQSTRQTPEEFARLPWMPFTAKNGYKAIPASLGIVNGSGGIRFWDLDTDKSNPQIIPARDIDIVRDAMGLPANYPWVYMTGGGYGWGMAFICHETLPKGELTEKSKEPGVYWGYPIEKNTELDHIELRWGPKGQTIIYGEHPTGPGYMWRYSPPTEAPAVVSIEAVLKGFRAIAVLGRPQKQRDNSPLSEPNRQTQMPSDIGRITIKQTAGEWAQGALDSAYEMVSTATEGTRNNTLFVQTAALAEIANGGDLTEATVLAEMTEAARTCGLEDDEIKATLESAIKRTGDKSRIAPDKTFSENGSNPNKPEKEITIPVPVWGIDLVKQSFPPNIFLIDGLIALGHFVILGGRPKSGKSFLNLTMIMCIDKGVAFLGRATRQAKTLYIVLEDGNRRIQDRMKALKWQPKSVGFLFGIDSLDGRKGNVGPGIIQIQELIAIHDFEFVVIDTLVSSLSGRLDENDNAQMAVVLNALAQLAHETNTAILLCHHTGKAKNDDPFDNLRGASAIRGAYDVGLLLVRNKGENEALLHVESRDMEADNMTLRQARNGAGWEYLGKAAEFERIKAGRKTLEAMLDHPTFLDGLTVEQIADLRKVSEQAIRQQLTALEKGGYAYRESPVSTAMGKKPDIWFIHDDYKE